MIFVCRRENVLFPYAALKETLAAVKGQRVCFAELVSKATTRAARNV